MDVRTVFCCFFLGFPHSACRFILSFWKFALFFYISFMFDKAKQILNCFFLLFTLFLLFFIRWRIFACKIMSVLNNGVFHQVGIENLRGSIEVNLKRFVWDRYLGWQLNRCQLALPFGADYRRHAPTSFVDSSTSIAKFIATFTLHMVAALILFDPKVAKRALFKFLVLNKLFEVSVLHFLLILSGLELFTG